jgi:hypothetical protein
MKHEDLSLLSAFYVTVVMKTHYLKEIRSANMEVPELLGLYSLVCVIRDECQAS